MAQEDYLYTKTYLVSMKQKLVLPIAFKSGYEAFQYGKKENLISLGYNMVMKGGDVRRLFGSGRIGEASTSEGQSTDGVHAVPSLGSKFPLGQLVMTGGVADRVATDAAFAAFALESLKRHANGDWGDLCEEDKKENEYALDKYLRLFSAYDKYPLPKIWIITEADRSVTTTLFPEEY